MKSNKEIKIYKWEDIVAFEPNDRIDLVKLSDVKKRFISKAEVEKMIDEFGETKCGFMDRNTCDKIDKKELKQKLKGEKK